MRSDQRNSRMSSIISYQTRNMDLIICTLKTIIRVGAAMAAKTEINIMSNTITTIKTCTDHRNQWSVDRNGKCQSCWRMLTLPTGTTISDKTIIKTKEEMTNASSKTEGIRGIIDTRLTTTASLREAIDIIAMADIATRAQSSQTTIVI